MLACAAKLDVGRRSSACAKELLDGTSSSTSWSFVTWKESSTGELLEGKGNRHFGLKQELLLSTSSFCS